MLYNLAAEIEPTTGLQHVGREILKSQHNTEKKSRTIMRMKVSMIRRNNWTFNIIEEGNDLQSGGGGKLT